MKFNATLCNTTAKMGIACQGMSEDYDPTKRAKGCGFYQQKAYNPIIKVICEFEHLTLRSVESSKVQYEILWEGEVLNRFATVKVAESYFIDFAGITKGKYNKMKRI